MKLENQYCSRELAIRLRDLGVINEITVSDPDPDGIKQDNGEPFQVPNVGMYYSVYFSDRNKEMKAICGDQEDAPPSMYNPVKLYSVSELGAMLPDGYVSERIDNEWYCYISHRQLALTEADARAKMLIYLLENGMESVSDVNKRFLNS